MRIFLLLFNFLIFFSCSGKDTYDQGHANSDTAMKSNNINTKPNKTVHFTIKVTGKIPHDIKAYTQGLLVHDGLLYESTGQYGESSIRKIKPETGEILQKTNLLGTFFGEGITIINNKLYCATWLEKTCLVYDPFSLNYEKQYQYNGEGWGLTDDGQRIIMSNGSSYLYFREPGNFGLIGNIQVKSNDYPVLSLNELEYVDGLVFANIYQQDVIAVIDLKSGYVLQWLDFGFLRDEVKDSPGAEVLNGIAYDRENDIYYITGKNWPFIYKVKLVDDN